MKQDSAGRLYRWTDIPTIDLFDGKMRRAGFRGDHALLTFNWIKPGQPRWKPHSHPFDQIVLTVEGRQMLEVEDELMECPPGSIVRVPANARHTGWPEGEDPVLNIDVFAPPREDYLFLVKHQADYPQPVSAENSKAYHQIPTAEPFTGRMLEDTSDVLYRWDELPKTEVVPGMSRAGFRGDDSILTFNWISPDMKRFEPHAHPFDQIALIVTGRMMLELDGTEIECGPGTIIRIPPNVSHTGWPLGDEPVLNIDVFAPPREDYLYLTDYQKGYRSSW